MLIFVFQRVVRALSINGLGGGVNDQGYGQRIVLPRADGNLVRSNCLLFWQFFHKLRIILAIFF